MIRPVGHVTDLIRRLKKWRGRRAEKGLEVETLATAIAYLEEYRTKLNTESKLLTCAAMTGDAIRINVRAHLIGLSATESPFVERGEDFDELVERFSEKFLVENRL